MKGVVVKGVQELVQAKFGTDAWERIKRLTDLKEPFFAVGEDYPDQLTMALVQGASQISGQSTDDLLLEIGRFCVSKTGRKAYPSFYSLVGDSPRDFFFHIERAQNFEAQNNPRAKRWFRCEDTPEGGGFVIHDLSRTGLCAGFRGMISGVGLLFNVELAVKDRACVLRGDPECILEVRLP